MKHRRRERNRKDRLLNDRVSSIILSVMVVAMLATIVLLVYQKSTRPSQTADFEGKIVDRWADYSNSRYDPKPYFHLVVELSDGKRITVPVDSNVYESARVGMRIRKRSGQIVLIESSNKSDSH